MTQEKLARTLGVTLRTVVRYENDLPPRGVTLVKLAALARDLDKFEIADAFDEEWRSESDPRIQDKAIAAANEIERWSDVGEYMKTLKAHILDVKSPSVRGALSETWERLYEAIRERQRSQFKDMG
jgi:transcriptional regulator with XRE-family HTH domain